MPNLCVICSETSQTVVMRLTPSPSLEDCSEDDSVKVDCNTSFERFSAKLRRLRWKIYQKVAAKNITKTDLNKYEILVGQLVNKFGYRELSKREILMWHRKVVKTRNDALNAPFYEHLFNDYLSDVSSQELPLVSHDKSDTVNVPKTRAKDDSVKKIFENQKAPEDLLENLPSLPNTEDEELEIRLIRLRGIDETDDFQRIKEEPEPLEYNTLVKKTMIPIQAGNEIKVEESRTNPEVKDIKSDIVEVLDDRTDTKENKTVLKNLDSDAFDAKQDFNDWFEDQIAMKRKKPKIDEVLANCPAPTTEDSYILKVYKKQRSPDSNDNQNLDVKSPDLLILMRACFILLITMCKTLKDHSDKISSFSNPNFPVTPYQVPHVHLQTPALLCVPLRDDEQLLLV